MSIRFERVILENWLVYRGRIQIDFGEASSEGKNIIVVHGLNGFGKTSLLRGVQWAFHDSLPDKDLKECFNKGAIRDGQRDLAVEIHFVDQGTRYQLIRRARARVDGGGEVTGHLPRPPELIKDGRALDGAIQDAIEQVLPKECQQFFFFDGLEIQTYASKQRPADIREAIERVLGIPEVRNLRADLGKVIDRWEDERDRHLEKNQEHHRLIDELHDLRTEEAGLREDLEAERKTRDALSGLLAELEKRAAELETIKTEQERLRDLERLKDSKERSLLEQEQQLDTAIHQAARQLALPILHRQVARLQTEVGTTDYRAVREGEMQARKKILEEILDSMQCICERDVPTPVVRTLEQKIKDIEGMLARQPSRDRGAAPLHERQNTLMCIIGKLESVPVNMTQTLKLKQRLELEIQELTQEIATLEDKLGEHGDVEVREVFQQLGEKRKEHQITSDRIKEKEERLRKVNENIDRKNHEVNQLALADKELASLTKALDLAMRSAKAVESLIAALLTERRRAIVDNINTVFRSITNKSEEYDRVELMDDFGVQVVTKNGSILPDDALSAGEKEVLAFAFIAGLSLSTERAAPLIMDTPFGHLDNRHRRGLLDALPNLPNQVVLLATDRDLPDIDIPRLVPALHRRFELIRDQRTETSRIEEVG